MDPTRRVWKWASAIVAVVSAALVAASLLLTQGGKPSADFPDSTETGREAVARLYEPRNPGGPPESRGRRQPALQMAAGGETPPHQAEITTHNSQLPTPKSQIPNPKSKIESSPAPNPEPRTPEVFPPLGLIEQADGRVQAVIEDGEWVQLVEEGQVLADHSRVVRISAEGVEVIRQAEAPAVELAEARHEKPEMARAAGALGYVQHSDGRVESVVADGQWVKVVAEPRGPAGGTLAAGSEVAPGVWPRHEVGPGTAGEPQDSATLSGAMTPPLRPGEEIQNRVEPIGVVEWAGGRTQAAVVQGDSVELVDDAVAVAATRRLLELLSPVEGDSEDFTHAAAGSLARPPEDEVAWLAASDAEPNLRAPPEGEASPPPEPEELARGQPERATLAEASRPPPEFFINQDGLWEADLPGIDDAPSASIEQLPLIEHLPREISDSPESARSGSVPGEAYRPAPRRDSAADSSAKLPASRPPSTGDGTMKLEPLGLVSWADGREQAVVLVGGFVVLVEAGRRLADGRCVVEVAPEGVVVAPAEGRGDAPQPGSPCQGSRVATEGHAGGPVSHLNNLPVSGSKLHSEPPIRDNREQPRE